MRLIDADRLKEEVNKKKVVGRFNTIMLIDNAQTINYPFYQEAYQTGYEEGKNDRPQGEPVIKCKDCKHQKKYWHEDKRMKDKGYWIYGCDLIGDSFIGTPVWGEDNQFCSSAEQKGSAKMDNIVLFSDCDYVQQKTTADNFVGSCENCYRYDICLAARKIEADMRKGGETR